MTFRLINQFGFIIRPTIKLNDIATGDSGWVEPIYFDVSNDTLGSIGTVPKKGTWKYSANDFPPFDENKFVHSWKLKNLI